MARAVQIVMGVGLLAGLLAAWWLGVADALWNRVALVTWVEALRGTWTGYGYTIGAFAAAGALLAPQTPIISACTIVFGPMTGFALSIAGLLTTAVAGYGAGHVFGANSLRRRAGSRLHRVSEALGRRGVAATIVAALLPIAPSGVVYFAAGASHIRFRDFLLGTAVGIVPGVAAVTLLTDQAARTIQAPTLMNETVLGVGAVVVAVVVLALARRFGRRWWASPTAP